MWFTPTQIQLLVKSLQWLVMLIGFSIILLLSSWIWLDAEPQAANPSPSSCATTSSFQVKRTPISTPLLQKGQSLFRTNCQSCHEMSTAKLVGPGLLGVSGRVPDTAWLKQWLKNPSAVLGSGDAYANQLVKAYVPVVMPGFPTLKAAEIEALLAYIDSYQVVEGMKQNNF